MPKRKSKKSTAPQYSLLSVKITHHSAAVDASVNHEVLDKRRVHEADSDTKIYSFDTRIEIQGECTYPETESGKPCSFTIYSSERRKAELSATLKDCHVIDDKWQKVYRTVKGQQVPVYDIPKSIGYFERKRGTGGLTGWLWLPQQSVTDMLILLGRAQQPLFLSIPVLYEAKIPYMRSFTLQTNDPAEE